MPRSSSRSSEEGGLRRCAHENGAMVLKGSAFSGVQGHRDMLLLLLLLLLEGPVSSGRHAL